MSAEFHFKSKDEVLAWFTTHLPEACVEYEAAKKRVQTSQFSGSGKLLKREADNKVNGFLDFLTELNIADLLLRKKVKGLSYEPSNLKVVDFVFDDLAMDVKNLHPKNYEKDQGARIDEMKVEGGGSTTFTLKDVSNVFLKVTRNAMGTMGWERTETGHGGVLGSDLFQMSPVFKWLSEFEEVETDKLKKVLFILVHTEDFVHYHAEDIGRWYFDGFQGYRPIFENDMSWYAKLFGKATKARNIDTLVFMFPPRPLIWPTACFGDVIKDRKRVLIYAQDSKVMADLQSIFS